MYAVTAWMVHPLTCLLVGISMNNNNNKKQQQQQTTIAKSQSGNPKLADCKKQIATQPSVDSNPISSEVPVPVVASTSRAAKALADANSAINPVLGAAGNTSATPAITGKELDKLKPISLPSAASTASTASTAEKAPDRRKPQRRAFVVRRAALRTVEKLGSTPEDRLTPEEKSSLIWARALLAKQEEAASTSADVCNSAATGAPKRQRSGEETSPPVKQQPETKRQRQNSPRIVNRPFSEVARNPLVRAIIDRGVSDGAISQEKWVLIRQKLLGVYWQILKENPGPSPQNDDAGWFQGHIKLLACTSERSALLLQLAVASLGELWPGARLDVVPVGEIPRRPRSIAVIPAEPHEPAEILAYIQMGNPDLPTHDWKVVKVAPPEGATRKVVVVLNQESLAPLRQRQCRIYYGFDSIRLRIYRGDDKPDTVAPSVKLEDPPGDDASTTSADDTTPSVVIEAPQSDPERIGELFGRLEVVEDEDALLGSDSEDGDVTVVYDPDGEGNTN